MPANPNKPYERRNIIRIDIKKTDEKSATHGWQVRFKRKDKKITQFFNDTEFGSDEKSLEAAKTFRDAMETELEVGKVSKGYLGERSKSGLIGIRRVKSINTRAYGKGTYEYYFWEANWITEAGKRETASFSISVHGEEEAFRLAVEAREKGTEYQRTATRTLFTSPDDETIKVWRYMDFTKFVSMLENKGLFFSKAEYLGDPFEGSFSVVNKNLRPLIRKHTSRFKGSIDIGELIRWLRSRVAISCWHMNEHESAGMWSLYAKTPEAVCIQSTYKKLRSCLPDNIEIGKVRYVDYLNEWIPESHLLAPFMYKRMSFEHEREIRAVINLSGLNELDFGSAKIKGEHPAGGGVWQPVNMDELIEKVYVAPYAPSWFGDLIRMVVKTYRLDKPVIKSSLDDEPIF